MEQVWDNIRYHARLSEASKLAWEKIMTRKEYKKDEYFIREGEMPLTIAFVTQGLFAQYRTSKHGELIIERFFPEKYMMHTAGDLIASRPSSTTIRALEPSVIWEFGFKDWYELMRQHIDIMKFYENFLMGDMLNRDRQYRINAEDETARLAYIKFKKDYPSLEPRLSTDEVAAYLGILPKHLEVLRNELN